MDRDKKALLLLWFSQVWGKPVKSLSELHDGHFFVRVLRVISHWKCPETDLDSADNQTRMLAVKTFLQDFYGTDGSNDVLNFDTVFSDDVAKKEMELAKMAVVLLGLAVIDKQGGDIVKKASLDLPEHFHGDLVCLLESVVQMNGPKFILSSSIEEALQKSPEKQGEGVLKTWFQKPKFECLEAQEFNNLSGTPVLAAACSASPAPGVSTPLSQCRKGSDSLLNTSFGISSPFGDLSIGNSNVSPFVTFIQSPQLIRKAILKEKELEVRQLKGQLNEQVLLREDVQLSLREKLEENAKKDSKIDELKHRIKELQTLQDAHDELQELKPKFAELEAKCDKLMNRQQRLEQYKTECQMLETETKNQREEIQSLHQEVHSLKSQGLERTEVLKTNRSLEKQVELLKVRLEESSRMKSLMEEELSCVRSNLEMMEEKNKELKKLTEDLGEDSFQGESMGVIVDLQLGEMRARVEELTQARADLQTEVKSLVTSAAEQNSVIDDMRKQIEASQQTNESLVQQLRGRSAELESLKTEITEMDSNHKTSLATLRAKHDEELKDLYSENEKKVASLVEGHEISFKRQQTATEKVVIKKDSLAKNVKELKDKILLLEESHTKDVQSIKTACEKRLSTQKTEFKENISRLREENDETKASLISEQESQLVKVQDINKQRLSLQKEEFEIELLKVKEEHVCALRIQQAGREKQVAELRKAKEETVQTKIELEKEKEILIEELTAKLESERLDKESQLKTVAEEQAREMTDVKSHYDKEIMAVQERCKATVASLEGQMLDLKEESAKTVEVLKMEHDKELTAFGERLSAAEVQHESQVQDLQTKIEESEQERIIAKDELIQSEERFSCQLHKQEQDYLNKINNLQQEKDATLLKVEEELKEKMIALESLMQDKLLQQKLDFEAVISSLQQENSETVSQNISTGQKLTNSSNENKELSTQVGLLQHDYSELKSLKTTLEEKLKIAEQINSECQSCQVSLQEEVQRLLDEKESLKCEKATIENELSTILKNRSELESYKVEADNQMALVTEENAEKMRSIIDLESQLSAVKEEISGVLSAKTMVEDGICHLKQTLTDTLSQKDSFEAKAAGLQEDNSKLIEVKSALETEVVLLQEKLSNLSSEKENIEEKCKTTLLESSELMSEKVLMEEELVCLKREHVDILSDKSSLEENVVSLQQQVSHVMSEKVDMEGKLSVKEKECEEVLSEKNELNDQIENLQKEMSVSKHSMKDVHCLEVKAMSEKFSGEISALVKHHESEISRVEKEKQDLMQEISAVKTELEVGLQRVKELESQIIEKDNTFAGFEKEMLKKLEQQKSANDNELEELRADLEEGFKADAAEIECSVKNQMMKGMEEKISLLNNENEKVVHRLQEEKEAKIVCLEEKYKAAMTVLQEQAEHEKADVEQRFDKLEQERKELIVVFEKEMLKKLEQQKSANDNELEELRANLEEGFKADAAEIECSVKNQMEEKISLLNNENEKVVHRFQEEKEAKIVCLEEKYKAAMTVLQEQVEHEKADVEQRFDKLEQERKELIVEKENHEKQVSELLEEKKAQEHLLEQLRNEAAENLNAERQLVLKLNEAVASLEAEKLSVTDQISTLQVEQSLEKENHEKQVSELLEEKKAQEHLLEQLRNEAAENLNAERQLVLKLNEAVASLEAEKLSVTDQISTLQVEQSLEKENHEKQVSELLEEKKAQEHLLEQLRNEAAENLNAERQLVLKLNEAVASLEAEKSSVTDQISTLQVETTKMLQIQKAEHEREMKMAQANSDSKLQEVTSCYEKTTEALKAETETLTNLHKAQMEEEVAKVRHQAEVAYEATLDDLKVQFETAKELELRALSDQKAELVAMKEQHERETQEQQSRMEEKLKETQAENNQLREREGSLMKSAEAQMKTANEFCNNLRQQLEAATAQVEATSNARERLQLYDQQVSKLKETNLSLANALKIEKETSGKMHKRLETHMSKHEKTKGMLDNAQKEARVHAIENNRLKTSLDYSERKLRSYKQQLEQTGNISLGSDAHFRKIIEEHDAEMLEDTFDANTSVISSYSLRSTISSNSVKSKGSTGSGDGSSNETIISADSVMMRRETLVHSSELKGAAGFRPTMQSCANEPEEFEWDRLSELKRRNTLCLPHMKSSYPVETQVAKKDMGSDDAVRLSLMPGDMANSTLNNTLKQGKRRSPRLSIQNPDEDNKEMCPNKKEKEDKTGSTTIYFPLVRDGAVYQAAGTGSSTSRSSDRQKVVASGVARKKLTPSKATKSPNRLATRGRSFKSPGLKAKSPARPRNPEEENKPSVAFSIEITPKKAIAPRSRTLQKRAFDKLASVVASATELRTSPQKKFRKPLATRNYRETGI